MTIPLGMDFETAAILAAIALAEGVVRVPPGATVLRRMLWGRWRVASTPDLVAGWGLVHRLPPLSHTVLLPIPPSGTALSAPSRSVTPTSSQERLHAIRVQMNAADALGLVGLLLLVLGVPVAVHTAGVIGGALAILACVSCQLGLAVLEWTGLGKLEVVRRERWRRVIRNLNPFSAPAASSRLLAEAVQSEGPIMAAKALLSHDDFARWSRPWLYDFRTAGGSHSSPTAGVAITDDCVTEVLGWMPKLAPGDKWCNRCAAVYQSWATECAECRLPLRSEPSAIPEHIPSSGLQD